MLLLPAGGYESAKSSIVAGALSLHRRCELRVSTRILMHTAECAKQVSQGGECCRQQVRVRETDRRRPCAALVYILTGLYLVRVWLVLPGDPLASHARSDKLQAKYTVERDQASRLAGRPADINGCSGSSSSSRSSGGAGSRHHNQRVRVCLRARELDGSQR